MRCGLAECASRGYRELTKVSPQMKDQSQASGVPAGITCALQAARVSKHFGGVVAVDAVSLTVRSGEIVGLIGPNGAGKTTLFDMFAGGQVPTSGEILIRDRVARHSPAHARLSLGLGRTFQIPRPFPELSVLDNVMLGAQGHPGEKILHNWLAPARVRRAEQIARAKARDLLDFVSLSPLAAQPARVLSGGQRKLLELARVLMADPAIMLLDEPAAGVHPHLLEIIATRIQALNARGMTFLIIEHNMDLIAALCGRLVVMAQGRVLCEGDPASVTSDPRVVEAYLGVAAS